MVPFHEPSIFILIASFSFSVKHDCVFGDDFDLNEITVVSEVQSNASLLLTLVISK